MVCLVVRFLLWLPAAHMRAERRPVLRQIVFTCAVVVPPIAIAFGTKVLSLKPLSRDLANLPEKFTCNHVYNCVIPRRTCLCWYPLRARMLDSGLC
jgi:hypothetical protein